MFKEEISKAIGNHGLWKARLLGAIETGKSEWDAQTVENHRGCEFGKWLLSIEKEQNGSEHFKKVASLHEAFHKEAARVLRLALAGNKKEALKAIDHTGTYARQSGDLTAEMVKWRSESRG